MSILSLTVFLCVATRSITSPRSGGDATSSLPSRTAVLQSQIDVRRFCCRVFKLTGPRRLEPFRRTRGTSKASESAICYRVNLISALADDGTGPRWLYSQ